MQIRKLEGFSKLATHKYILPSLNVSSQLKHVETSFITERCHLVSGKVRCNILTLGSWSKALAFGGINGKPI